MHSQYWCSGTWAIWLTEGSTFLPCRRVRRVPVVRNSRSALADGGVRAEVNSVVHR